MKSSEFLNESQTAPLSTEVSAAMPATFVMPELKNQDVYLQYRFGMALASARARNQGEIPYEAQSEWGENMVVVAHSKEEEETLKMALRIFGSHNSSRQISTTDSTETSDVNATSPIVQNSGKRRKSNQ